MVGPMLYTLLIVSALASRALADEICNGPYSSTTYSGGTRPCGSWTSWGGLTLVSVTFLGCSSASDLKDGGAIYFESTSSKLSCTQCVFDGCTAQSGYGAAVFSNSPNTFVYDRCTVKNMQPEYSVLHMQCGGRNSAPVNNYAEAIRLTGNVFQDISISPPEARSEGGGCGLVVRFPTTLELVECQFHRCSTASPDLGGGAVLFTPHGEDAIQKLLFQGCVFRDNSADVNGGAIMLTAKCLRLEILSCEFTGKKGPQSGKGGFVMLSAHVTYFGINDTTFDKADANDGGCIYASGSADGASFIVDNCTISAAGARDGEYALVVKAKDTQIKGLYMKNMPGFHGKIELSDLGFKNNQLKLDGCTFENFGTGQLFTFGTSASFTLTLSGCRFLGVISNASNLLQMEGNEKYKYGFNTLKVSDCIFDSACGFRWAIVQSAERTASSSSAAGSCTIERTRFEGLNVTQESALTVKGCASFTITDCYFKKKQGTTLEGVLDIGNKYLNKNALIKGIIVEQCDVTKALVLVGDLWTLTMQGCDFVSCTTSGDALVSATSNQISQCLFNACGAAKYLVSMKSSSGGFTLSNVRFISIKATMTNLIYIRETTFNHLYMTDCALSDVVWGTEPNDWGCNYCV